MVKLIAARTNRLYGPSGSESVFEIINAVVYMAATILLLGGMSLLLANFSHPLQYDKARTGLILIAIAMCIVILVNLHDLAAQVVGIDYRLDLLAYDYQLALIEVAAPIVYIIGATLYLIGVIIMLQSKSLLAGGRERAALELLIAGSAFWVLGSIHNACQVYNRASLHLQVFQKATYLPLLIASTLFLVSSVLWLKSWPHFVVAHTAQYAAIVLAIVATGLLVLGALTNIFRVLYLRRMVEGTLLSYVPLDTLRGRAYEELEGGSAPRRDRAYEEQSPSRQLLLEQGAPPGPAPTTSDPSPIVEEETFAVIR